MNEVIVSNLEEVSYDNNIRQISLQLDKHNRYTLAYSLWGTPRSSFPVVQFAIAYSDNCIFLKFYVKEKQFRAVNTVCNDPVWEDSCVEFFIAFNETGYYNFEFNCIGTTLLGFGKDKQNRILLPPEIISKIKCYSTIKIETEMSIDWELAISIPLEVFSCQEIETLQNKECRANFYKCGDLLPEPHYLSWNNIIHPEPNFHLPVFFGKLFFD